MKVLHLLVSGNTGGIESLVRDYALYSEHENIFVFAWSGGAVAEQIRESGSQVIIMNKNREGSLAVSRKILDICDDLSVDAIVVHHEAPLLRIVAMSAKRRWPNIRVYCYAHSVAQTMCGERGGRLGGAVKRQIYRYTFQKADKAIAISAFVKTSLIEYLHVPEEHIAVIYNGVDLSRFLKERKPREHGQLRLVYTGRVVREKGIQSVLDALSRVRNVDFFFTIVGDGSYRDTLIQRSKALGLEEKVAFLGARTDVPELLTDADVFVHVPECQEGFGIAVVEAMASGLICVCGSRGGIPEIVKNGINGFLVQDAAELEKVLPEIAQNWDSAYYQTIREEAVKTAKTFSIKHFSGTLDRLLETE